MAQPLNNVGAGPEQAEEEMALEFLTRADSRPLESLDIERLLSSEFYSNGAFDYAQYHPTPSSTESNDEPHSRQPPNITPPAQNSPPTQEKSKNIKNIKNNASKDNNQSSSAREKTSGTKRKAEENEEPSERRRKQIREAQRAYRQRKISQTAHLEERVKVLEKAIENMSSVVLSFSEELIGSNVLSCQSELTGRLRDALSTCLALVRETGRSSTDDSAYVSDPDTNYERGVSLVPSVPPPIRAKPSPVGLRELFSSVPYPETSSRMAVTTFMDMVCTSAVYYGYLALADPTLSSTRLHRHFGLPLQLMDRNRLLAYFAALFQARMSRTGLIDHKDRPSMPFLSIGGAGTHYSPVMSGSATGHGAPLSLPWGNPADQRTTWSYRNNAWTVPMDVSNVPDDIQDRFEGDWFDLQDLELWLAEKNVNLRMRPSNHGKGDVNVPLFIRALMLNTTCLGLSPGFRRADAEKALQSARAS